jgi:UDP-N-acetylmuramate dehydrogenase
LIEEAGFKGLREGPLTVSEIHGNFIVNTGGASFDDIVRLERRICREVLKNKGIRLRREVIYLTPEGQKY